MSSLKNMDTNSRRDFLKKAALAGMGTTLGSVAMASTDELSKKSEPGIPGRFTISMLSCTPMMNFSGKMEKLFTEREADWRYLKQ